MAEKSTIADFLDRATRAPAGLLIEGEAGIGKSTLLLSAVEEALSRGFRVLSAGAAAAESVLAYAALTDLLRGVDAGVYTDLPGVQMTAIERVLMLGDDSGRPTFQQEVAAGFLAVVERLTEESPTLVAIDDLQWLDTSSQKALAYVVRRLTGPIGVLASVRTDTGVGDPAAWMQMGSPEALDRISVPPMNLGSLHAMVVERLGKRLRRPTMVRICQASGGNPFYTLELARAAVEDAGLGDLQMPSSLAQLVRARIGSLDADVRELLLAAACVAEPTVELISAATDRDADNVFDMLAQAERNGIVDIDGSRMQFEHPLLARGVYTAATTAERRAMHRRLAGLIEQPELRARHLALSAVHGDQATIDALDAAAEIARVRGAPANAAELLDMAIELSDDTAALRIRSAREHFNAGDAGRARARLQAGVVTSEPTDAEALTLLGVMEYLEGSRAVAARLLQRALDRCGDNLALRVQILVPLALALFNDHQREAATSRAAEAVAAATRLSEPQLLSQALSTQVSLACWSGRGLDEAAMQRALALEDPGAATPIVTRPSMHHAMLLACAGQLDEARAAMRSISADCEVRGKESEHIIVAIHRVLVENWRGNFSDAAVIAEDAVERARLLDGDLPIAGALTARAAVAAYIGRPDDARRDFEEAQPAIQAAGAVFMTACHATLAGFLEVSLGNYGAALSGMDPLLSTLDPLSTEIYLAGFVPDAVEALVALGRLDQAEPLVDAFERNGSRLDRPWMLAVGARGRAMLLAAGGDLDGADRAVQAAMIHHDRLQMPFERARTQVLLGQLQRRMRQKDAASATLRDAVAAFESMGVSRWAERARSELARADVAHSGTDELTPSEQRVAELAAAGMSNKDIAAKLFISPKTVETNLARTYRKLEIHSRTQLANRLRRPNP